MKIAIRLREPFATYARKGDLSADNRMWGFRDILKSYGKGVNDLKPYFTQGIISNVFSLVIGYEKEGAELLEKIQKCLTVVETAAELKPRP